MNADAKEVLPAQPTSVDLNGWNVTRDAYSPVQTRTVDTKTVTNDILAALRTELATLGINAEEFAVAVEKHVTPHLAKIPRTTKI
jgi:sulfur carrier protein ThiS